MFQSQKIKSLIGLGGAAAVAATALSGCVVSNDPNVNAAATTSSARLSKTTVTAADINHPP